MEAVLCLHDRQSDALRSPATEILYGGAAGGGKSHLLRAAALVWSLKIPGLQTYLFRRVGSDLIKNHMQGPQGFPALLAPWTDAGLARIRHTRNSIDFANGSRISLCHCQHEKDMYKYQGAEMHLLLVDELTHFTREMYVYLRGRVRLSGLALPDDLGLFLTPEPAPGGMPQDRPQRILDTSRNEASPEHAPLGSANTASAKKPPDASSNGPSANHSSHGPAPRPEELFPRVIACSNPGGVGHNWVKAAFIDNARPYEIRRMPASEGGMARQYIPARTSDNPSLLKADPGYLDRLEGLGNPALVRAMKLGDWDIVAGGAFDDLWNRDVHTLPPFDIPTSWRIDRSFDWGSSRPFSAAWWAESDGSECLINGQPRHFPRGTLFRIAEYYGWNGSPNQGCKLPAIEAARRLRETEAVLFPSRAVHPGPADSAIYAADNASSIAADMERAGVAWTAADKRPGSRKAGFQALRARLSAALAASSGGEDPALYVFNTCSHFIRTVPVLPRDARDPDDVDSAAEDHCYDDARYRVMEKRRFVRAD